MLSQTPPPPPLPLVKLISPWKRNTFLFSVGMPSRNTSEIWVGSFLWLFRAQPERKIMAHSSLNCILFLFFYKFLSCLSSLLNCRLLPLAIVLPARAPPPTKIKVLGMAGRCFAFKTHTFAPPCFIQKVACGWFVVKSPSTYTKISGSLQSELGYCGEGSYFIFACGEINKRFSPSAVSLIGWDYIFSSLN